MSPIFFLQDDESNLSEVIQTEIPDPGKEEIMAKNNEFIQNLKKIMEEPEFLLSRKIR